MAGFSLRKTPGVAQEVFGATISSLAVAVGDCLTLLAGSTAWTACSSTTEHYNLKAVAITSASTSDTSVQCILVRTDQLWEADAGSNTSVNGNGDRMIFTDANTINNSGTDVTNEDVAAIQIAPVGATGDKRLLVRFVGCYGVDPAATSG